MRDEDPKGGASRPIGSRKIFRGTRGSSQAAVLRRRRKARGRMKPGAKVPGGRRTKRDRRGRLKGRARGGSGEPIGLRNSDAYKTPGSSEPSWEGAQDGVTRPAQQQAILEPPKGFRSGTSSGSVTWIQENRAVHWQDAGNQLRWAHRSEGRGRKGREGAPTVHGESHPEEEKPRRGADRPGSKQPRKTPHSPRRARP